MKPPHNCEQYGPLRTTETVESVEPQGKGSQVVFCERQWVGLVRCGAKRRTALFLPSSERHPDAACCTYIIIVYHHLSLCHCLSRIALPNTRVYRSSPQSRRTAVILDCRAISTLTKTLTKPFSYSPNTGLCSVLELQFVPLCVVYPNTTSTYVSGSTIPCTAQDPHP